MLNRQGVDPEDRVGVLKLMHEKADVRCAPFVLLYASPIN